MIFSLFIICQLYDFPPKEEGYIIKFHTSLDAFKFTPRYTPEHIPGYQIFISNRIKGAYSFSVRSLLLSIETGVVNRVHITYFYTYSVFSVEDILIEGILRKQKFDYLLSMRIPSANYKNGAGSGTYAASTALKLNKIFKKWGIFTGYQWDGKNPDDVDIGDRIYAGFLNDNLMLSGFYQFRDRGSKFEMHDSFSLSLNIKLFKTIKIKKVPLSISFEQTIFGKDVEMLSIFEVGIKI